MECRELKDGEIYELITPFLPAPLIDSAKEKGYLAWSKEEPKHVFKTYLMPIKFCLPEKQRKSFSGFSQKH
jgi:hypothetical protein